MGRGQQIYKISRKDTPLCLWRISSYLMKIEKQLETLIKPIRIYSQVIEMEFGIVKCAMLTLKSWIIETMEGIELPNQERMHGEKENYKYLEILEVDIIKQTKMIGLVCWVLWHINLCRLFNAKSIFM